MKVLKQLLKTRIQPFKLGKKLVKEIQQTELDTDDGPSMEDSMKEIIEEMKSGDAEDWFLFFII